MSITRTDRIVSRRTALAGLGAGTLGLALAATTRQAAAQDAAAEMANHPLVGTWHLTLPGPTGVPFHALISYTADGIVTQLAPGPANGMGAWEATGPRTGVLTVTFINTAADDPTKFESFGVARNMVEVDATGDAYAGQGEIEFRAFDGTTIDGPYGPFPVDGTRVQVETTFALVTAAASPEAAPAP